MFFLASKIIGVLAPASNLLFIGAFGAWLLLYSRFYRHGRSLLIVVLVGTALCGFGPVGNMLMRPLEDRFERPADDAPPPAGIIVLGGGVDPETSDARQSLALNEGGGRIADAAVLALKYPQALLVFSGGSPAVFAAKSDEAGPSRRFFIGVGIDQHRILLENQSRNTYENAVFTRALVKPQPGQRWLLVTSASHMPRAVGSFREAGFPVVPYPSSYRTSGKVSDFWAFQPDLSEGLAMTDAALHEWIGLLTYRLTKKTDAFFPAPGPQR